MKGEWYILLCTHKCTKERSTPKAGRKRNEEIAALREMKDGQIDKSDVPELADWSGAVVGRFYRPVKPRAGSPEVQKEKERLHVKSMVGNGQRKRFRPEHR
jgi:hypothetical protein